MSNKLTDSILTRKTKQILAATAFGLSLFGLTFAASDGDAVDAAETFASEGVYTEEQADTGKETYSQLGCNTCHGSVLEGAFGPGLRGSAFVSKWTGTNLDELVQYIYNNMPPTEPRSLDQADIIDIVAHILRTNSFPSSEETLLTEESVESIVFGEQPE